MSVRLISLTALLMLLAGVGAAQDADSALPGVGTELLTNGGFEQELGAEVPGWTLESGAKLITEGAHTGRRCIKVQPPSPNVMSAPIRYYGGRLKVSGWVKIQDVVTGSQPWHKAVVQFATYDRDGQPAGHRDLYLEEGTHGWRLFESTVIFSRFIGSVRLRAGLWGDASGMAWFDDFSLQYLDDPRRLVRPLHKDKAVVTVAADCPLGRLGRAWRASDVGWPDRTFHPVNVQAYPALRRAGIRYLRIHGCLWPYYLYREDDKGRGVYEWQNFDLMLDTCLGAGFIPVVVLEGTPDPIAGRHDYNWKNRYPPQDYDKFQEVVRQVVLHCQQRYGTEAIRQWWWEVWNEPFSKGYFLGTEEDYVKIYDRCAAAVKSVDRSLRIGPSDWYEVVLEHGAQGRNHATGQRGTPIDFVAFHCYGTGTGLPVLDRFTLALQRVKQTLARYPQYRNLPILVTETGPASSPNLLANDSAFSAAFRLALIEKLSDPQVKMITQFAVSDSPFAEDDGFYGHLGLVSREGFPKASLNLLRLLEKMRGSRIALVSSNDPIGGLASGLRNGTTWVVLYNMVEKPDIEPFATQTTVQVKGLPEELSDLYYKRWLVAPGVSEPFQLWQEMGQLRHHTPMQRTALAEAAKLQPPEEGNITVNEGVAVVRFSLPVHSVTLLELRPAL